MTLTQTESTAQRPTAPGGVASRGVQPWHTLTVEEALRRAEVTARSGLTDAEVRKRLTATGPNQLREGRRTPAWRRILALLTDKMTLVLLVAAVVSAVVAREWETPVVIAVVIVLNTVLNFVQESKAASSLAALQDATVSTAVARREDREQEVPTTDLVPGDIVLLDAGDAVPADGRLLEAVRLQVSEAPLTGESEPVEKEVAALLDPALATADRTDMLYMNTEVTRGRGVMVVTATGMATEIGTVAAALDSAGQESTPLQRRTDQLAGTLTAVAVVVVAIVFVIGLLRGQGWSELLVTSVSLAVATIPEGLTAVLASTLAIGASTLAKRGAIVKRLAAVETLGSTTDIATDKTGTLTLNQMTVRRVLTAGRRFTVTGQGYETEGVVLSSTDQPVTPTQELYLAMALCNDATVRQPAGRNATITGDPTEAALVVLAEKGGLDVDRARGDYPRVAEVPFDSDDKFMATFHERARGAPVDGIVDQPSARYRCFAKGALSVLLSRSDSYTSDDGDHPLTEEKRQRIGELVDELAADGLRTLAIAARRIDDDLPGDAEELRDAVDGLTLLGVVGIMDPPRAEVRDAIATARGAGIRIHLITGDNLVTARTIADALGIDGEMGKGTDLEAIDDEELRRRAPHYGVLARVSPQHKIRMVRALQAGGAVVAMTGDGVNDAPALKQADIGVAMGVIGTDVSKGAADVILTDDNFATVVAAVEIGRGIYANIVKFVRFQLTTAWGFVLIFLSTSVLGIAGGAPFTALQILLVNLIMDGPPALALGVDKPGAGSMNDPPRQPREPLLTRERGLVILYSGAVMTLSTVAVLVLAPSWFPGAAGDPLFATTLAFATFVFAQVFNLLNVRAERGTVFSRSTFTNRAVGLSVLAVVILLVAVVQVPLLQGLFDTTSLSSSAWLTALVGGSSVLWVEELRKVVLRAVRAVRGRGAAHR